MSDNKLNEDFKEEDNELLKESATLDEEEDIQDTIASLLYGNRLRDLVRSVAKHEGQNVMIGKKGINGMQNAMKFLTVMLSYEILEVLKNKNKTVISPVITSEALNNMVGKSDSLNRVLLELEELKGRLHLLSGSTSISKATDYVNLFEREIINEHEVTDSTD
ncbi:hypothetical protein PC41400_27125 [Paenibacillus chitinolyticus]|uniref:Uncharacterized protein n=1 Tax=Paenibacillus chitinolyticus TaxID=79263 RepID=A0A410X3G3_9BACL|nr:hypothetical protein [Paenibacillus chitinolyticus]MCY9592993.1 hypothetical protein [Paenibacillus chitinolyticus]MCY9598937.1 hypothetical protein [Paenibacillus chitinolyticus]QAV21149.1 hypothetical protein PC41400_27125 [Paenibacillus chitinolyticus]